MAALAGPGNAQQTVNGGITMLGPLRSNGSAAAVDFTSAASTSPVKSGTLAARPGVCGVGQMYFATDAPAGQNLSYCTPPGNWITGGGGGGVSGPCQLASSLGFALNGADETALLNTKLTAMMAAGGGCLAVDAGKALRADGQVFTLSVTGFQPTVRITGAAALGGDGINTPTAASGSRLDLRYTGGPKILTVYNGSLEIDHIAITTGGSASDCSPYIQTTNTALYMHDFTLWGGPNHTPANNCNDGIILGGTSQNYDYSANGAFSGYGTVIRDGRFLGMARAIVGQSQVNGVVIDSNYIQGGNTTTPVDAAIALIGFSTGGSANRGNQVRNNLIEQGNVSANSHLYRCGIRLLNAQQNSFAGNQFWDGDSTTYAFCGQQSAVQNVIDKSNFLDGAGNFTDANWASNNYMPWRTIPFFFDGGGGPLTGTVTRCGLVSFGGQITTFSMAADLVGSARVTVKTAPFETYTGPASATDISNGGELLSAAVKLQDGTLTNWNKTVLPNTMMCFTLSSPAGINWVGGAVQVWEGR
jgi:hypothetical protein